MSVRERITVNIRAAHGSWPGPRVGSGGFEKSRGSSRVRSGGVRNLTAHESGQEALKKYRGSNRVGSGGVRNLTAHESGQEALKTRGSSRVGSEIIPR